MRRSKVWLIVCLCARLAPLAAQETTPREYAVDEVIERACERNQNLRAIAWDARARRSAADQAGRWRDPEVGLEFDRRRQYPGNAAQGGLNSNSGSTDFGRVSLAQEIPRPGRLRALARAEDAAADANEARRALTELEVRGRVLSLIYAFKVADEKLKHARERFGRFATIETFMKSRPFVSPQARAEVAIVKAKLFGLQRTFRQLEAGRQTAWNDLNQYVGFEREVPIRADWIRTPRRLNEADLRARAETANLDVRQRAYALEGESQALTAARLTTWPDLTLTGVYSDGAGANPERTFTLGVALPIPVLNGNRGAIGGAVAQRAAAEERLRWSRLGVERELRSAFARFAAVSATLADLSVAKLPALEADVRESDRGFRKGQVDLLTYLETDAQHIDAVFAILDTQLDYLAAFAEVHILTGERPGRPEGP